MKSILKTTLLFLLVIVQQNVLANNGDTQLRTFLKNNESFQATFTQSLFNEHGFEMQFSAGKFSLKKPGKFLWDYEEPYPQVIVSNGKKIWMFDSELEQVTVKPVDETLSNTSMVLLFNQSELDESFNMIRLDVDKGIHWVELTSKNASAEFSHILVGMKDNLLVSLKLIDGFNQTTEIKFSDIKTNPSFAAGFFDFKIPKHVDVIGE